MDIKSVTDLADWDPNNAHQARAIVEWTLGWAFAIANQYECAFNAYVDTHQGTDMIIFMSTCFLPTQAPHAQYINIDLTQLDLWT